MRINLPREVSGRELADAIIRAGDAIKYFYGDYLVEVSSQKGYTPIGE